MAGYEALSIKAKHEILVAKRSLPIMEKDWMEYQMEPRRQQLLAQKAVLEEEYKRTRTELAAKLSTERDHTLNWTTSTGLVFGYDRTRADRISLRWKDYSNMCQ